MVDKLISVLLVLSMACLLYSTWSSETGERAWLKFQLEVQGDHIDFLNDMIEFQTGQIETRDDLIYAYQEDGGVLRIENHNVCLTCHDVTSHGRSSKNDISSKRGDYFRFHFAWDEEDYKKNGAYRKASKAGKP